MGYAWEIEERLWRQKPIPPFGYYRSYGWNASTGELIELDTSFLDRTTYETWFAKDMRDATQIMQVGALTRIIVDMYADEEDDGSEIVYVLEYTRDVDTAKELFDSPYYRPGNIRSECRKPAPKFNANKRRMPVKKSVPIKRNTARRR